jgi:hypothetical protein
VASFVQQIPLHVLSKSRIKKKKKKKKKRKKEKERKIVPHFRSGTKKVHCSLNAH